PLLLISNCQGLTVQGNTFTDNFVGDTIIDIFPTVQDLRIVDNVISCTAGVGIEVAPSPGVPVGPSSMVIANNHIDTAGQGLGIALGGEPPGLGITAKVEGNDLQDNQIGVRIDPTAPGGSVTSIDLGGGLQGSLGANDFRGDATAIEAAVDASAGPIQAQMN